MHYKIHSLLYRKDILTAIQLFKELRYLIDALPGWVEKKKNWLIAHPSKKIIALNELGFSEDALAYVDYLIVRKKPINIVLADENEDDSTITILYKNTPSISIDRYLLMVTIKSLSGYNDVDDFVNIFKAMINYNWWYFRYILLDTEQYRFNQREVFDDRLPVGWMLYLPVKIKHEHVPSAFKVFDIEKNSGTIVVSKSVFDGKEPFDITCANNVEIELAANGLLPLIKGL
ncbi:MAG: Imm52 family immunity protein [Citrobacter sp.]|uniref:hypothetical protein n=1 Tax=Citrobacter sp. TaxID=1896336 RepID=UPI002FCAD04C